MNAVSLLASFLAVGVANYYVSTFSIWFGHWFSHRPRSALAGFHMLGHHSIFPDSRHTRGNSEAYQGGEGATNSAFSLLPWLVLQVALQAVLLPFGWFSFCAGQLAALLLVINYVHEQFHVEASPLGRFRWFIRARAVHDLHHDEPRNFMVVDHFWDRVFRTFVVNPGMNKEAIRSGASTF